jgi:hypothetical protein
MARPSPTDYPEYFAKYVQQVSEDELIPAMRASLQEIVSFLDSIPATKAEYRYAEGKWTVKEVLQHLIDAERIFAYRALCFARKEKQSLPGFDENEYAQNSDLSARSLKDLKEELLAVRETVYMLFRGFSAEMIKNQGIANNKPFTVNSMGYIIMGHVRHHFNILKERYL